MAIKKNAVKIFVFLLTLFILGSCDVLFSDFARKLDLGNDTPGSTFYRVTFDPNGGLGTPLERTAPIDLPVSSWPSTPLWENGSRTFLRWVTIHGTTFTSSSPVYQDMTVYALWSTDTPEDAIIVVFDLRGGSGNFPLFQIMSSTNNFRATPPLPPERLGYTFTNWFYNDNSTERLWTFSDEVEEDILLYAGWNIKNYIVIYHENNGVTDSEISRNNAFTSTELILNYQNGALNFTPPPGKVFANWNTSNPALSPLNPNPASTRFHPGQNLNILPGWGNLANASTINLYAIWVDDVQSTDTFTVSFNLNGGSLASHPAPQSVDENDFVDRPPNDPSRTGYSFLGWYDAIEGGNLWYFDGEGSPGPGPTEVKEDTVLFARWAIRSYRVAYNANGGSGNLPSGGTFEYDETVSILSPGSSVGDLSLEGYRFLNWNTLDSSINPTSSSLFPGQNVVNLNGWDDDTTAAGSPLLPLVTLYAQWARKTYTVSFNANLGSFVNAIPNVSHDSSIDAPAPPTRTGFTFAGWYTKDGTGDDWGDAWVFNAEPLPTPPPMTVTDNITLHAKWTPLAPVTITFNSNWGTPVTRTITTTYGSTITAPSSFTREGWVLTAWYTDATAGEQFIFANTPVLADTTLYARWVRAPFGNGDDIPFHVRNEYELRRVGRGPTLNTGEHAAYADWTLDKNYVQVNSFTMEEGDFIPIGVLNTVQPFTGTYNGEYEGVKHTITNLSISRTEMYTALFAQTSQSAVISNLGLINVSITGRTHTGSLVGYNNGGRIENCFATGWVLSTDETSSTTNIGGLVGHNRGHINESYTDMEYVSTPTVFNGIQNVGGLVGNNSGLITNSYAAVRDVRGSVYVGGLVGYNSGTINATYATALVISYSDNHFGGIAGYNYTGAIISDSAALNPGLERSSGAYGNARRITAMNQGTLTNNYARIMRVLNNTYIMPYLIPNSDFSYLIYLPNNFDHYTYWGAHIYQALALPDLFMNYSALLNLLNEDWWRGNGSNFFNNLQGPGFDISSNPDSNPATDSVWVYTFGQLPTLRNTTGRVQNPMPRD